MGLLHFPKLNCKENPKIKAYFAKNRKTYYKLAKLPQSKVFFETKIELAITLSTSPPLMDDLPLFCVFFATSD